MLEQVTFSHVHLSCRWEGAAQQGAAWLGQFLDPVRIDTMGKFMFVLVRLDNRQGSSRLLVRGWQGCSQAVLMQGVEKEVSPFGKPGMTHRVWQVALHVTACS